MQKKSLGLTLAILTAATAAIAAPKPAGGPKQLLEQVTRLTDLLRDSRAIGYPEATMTQVLKPSPCGKIALAVFSIEGFGGGNNFTQYLAVFNEDSDDEDSGGTQTPPHFTFVDVLQVAGKGWRGINGLGAKVACNAKTFETTISIPALAVGPNDGPNFPSKPTTIEVMLKAGRLAEIIRGKEKPRS